MVQHSHIPHSGHSLPPVEYRLFIPAQLTQPHPAVLLHGFATTGLQLFGATGWVRQYVRAGYAVLLVDFPFHGESFIKDSVEFDAKLPAGTAVLSGSVPVDEHENMLAEYARALSHLIEQVPDAVAHSGGPAEMQILPAAHVMGFSFGARTAWELSTLYPERVVSLVLGGLPVHDHLYALDVLLNASPESLSESQLRVRDEAQQAFEPILSGSILETRALADFVALPYAPLAAELSAGRLPAVPVLLVAGDEDSIAADTPMLLQSLEAANRPAELLMLPGRDHVNALTSGVFRRAALAHAASADSAV
ncbi:MAG: alpha/beta hydrolase [Rothia sp. (in: high G+C Gram-positive bacteria)]|uniref:alpha/beta hydrolase family protein n=1 Tax=Rothia sp. (in: high G+C Gram-positive bacteria) TaxID=1885016 RepID=UPI0026DF370C|nr:alpha/beta hydrolase [Rothia sp. (in: high G+C Gram-positive bacteria)]MDO5750181.1 alpha/beta hydrolase [Rothia sp. (in: high G+C Gram-positive bacteria)]